MNKADLTCIAGCGTDHQDEADFEHNCAVYFGCATMSDGPTRPVEVPVSASRSMDEDGSSSLVGVGLCGLPAGDLVLDVTPEQARRLAAMLLAAADALEPVRVAPKRARRPVCTARVTRPVAAAQAVTR